MIHKKKLTPIEVTKINKTGKHLKIINAEAGISLTVLKQGREVLSTDARAGFEFSEINFDEIILESLNPQNVEVWASDISLGYDAPTSGANRYDSIIVEHYGDDQTVLDFEVGRVKASIYGDVEYFVGGDNCTVESGLPMQPFKINEIEGAGALNISTNLPANQTLKGVFEALSTDPTGGGVLRYPTAFNGDFYGLPTAASHGLLAKFDGAWQLNLSGGINYYALFMLDDGVAYYDDFYRLKFKSKGGAVTQLAASMPSFRSGNVLGRWVCATGYNDSASSNFKAVNVDDGAAIEHVHPASVKGMYFSSSLNKTIFVQGDNVATADGLPDAWGGIPALTEIYSGSIGSVPNSRITENKEHIVISGDSGALIIKKEDMTVIFDSSKNTVFASRDGRVKAFDQNQFYISENGGVTWGVAVQDTGLNLTYANRKYSVIEKKGEFYILREFGTPTVFKFAAEKETSKPKSIFRIMRGVA